MDKGIINNNSTHRNGKGAPADDAPFLLKEPLEKHIHEKSENAVFTSDGTLIIDRTAIFTAPVRVVDTLILSDIHLGSEVSRPGEVLSVLKQYRFDRLILNGDVFDDLNFKRLGENDWELFHYLRRIPVMNPHCEIVWIVGNHDGPANKLSTLLGVPIHEEYEWEYEGRKYLIVHGDRYDRFLYEHTTISNLASLFYLLLQKLDTKKQRISRWIKHKSKSWLSLSDKIARQALDYAGERRADVVICGHTHLACEHTRDDMQYYNSGCWTDIPSQFITVARKRGVEVHTVH
jgi:UDP-2,3-diacylglucosamine pyrophosphatase LpxH